ncbi:MAG: hypothetical protein KBF82_09345 [Chitinophagaceae bacterium]|nr:hypothetical protein [Chitinophagaceae bacterium]
MSTIIVAIILIAVIAVFSILLVANERKKTRRKMNLLLIAFSQAAIRHTLFISKQEIINDSIIGLDGKNRKLLVVYQNEDNIYDEVIINLEEVERITVESVTAIMDAGHSKNARTDQFLEKVVLRFLFNSGKAPYDFPFFTHKDSIYQLQELQHKAKQWEATFKPLLKLAR